MNILQNHKFQAFCLTFLCFMFLFVFIIFSQNWLKVELKNEAKFSLAIQQFAVANAQSKPVKEIQKEKKEVKEKPLPKKIEEKKIVKKEEPKPLQKPVEKQIQAKAEPNLEEMKSAYNPLHSSKAEILSFGKDDNPLLKAIKRAIDNARIYPRKAQRMRIQGEVLLEFVWNANSTLSGIKIIQSSGHKILDENAVKTIHIASLKFPKHSKNIRLQIPIAYQLN